MEYVQTMNMQELNGRDVNKVYMPSGEYSASALIDTGTGVVGAIVVTTDGVNDALCVVYDNTSAIGTVVARCPVKAADQIGGMVIPFRVKNGIYATISGSGAKYQIYYL